MQVTEYLIHKWDNSMFEIKVLISYLVVCITYSLCRLHYLLTIRSDEEFNDMLQQLKEMSGDDDVVKTLVVLQVIFSPILAPFSILKQLFKLIKKIFIKEN